MTDIILNNQISNIREVDIITKYKNSKDNNVLTVKSNRTGSQLRTLTIPNVSEREVIKHYTILSQKNFCIDANFYPLGSCTMKYNPRINERIARLAGFANIHPSQDISEVQGALEVIYELQNFLCDITGFNAASLWPAAGAHGEYCGIAVIKKFFETNGEKRRFILVPESAHGTNPASAKVAGFEVINIALDKNGNTDLSELEKVIKDHGRDIAAIMITNPTTCGMFDTDAKQISSMIHSVGGFFYCDGANFNAIVGKIKPADFGADIMHFNLHKTFSTPHGGGGPGCGPVACCKVLAEHLPSPFVIKNTIPQNNIATSILDNQYTFEFIHSTQNSMGKMKGFYGNFMVMVRALSYIKTLGYEGLKQVAEDSVLSANYIFANLRDVFFDPYYYGTTYEDVSKAKYCMHECLFTDKFQKEHGVTTNDISKVLLDYGIHPMTVFFPIVVTGAMLIEPTETETKDTLDRFIKIMRLIASKTADPSQKQDILSAPTTTIRSRVDDVLAAKQLVVSG